VPYPHRIAHTATIGGDFQPVPLPVFRARDLLCASVVHNCPHRRRTDIYRQRERVSDVCQVGMWHDYLQESRIHLRESLLQRMVRNVDIDNIRITALAGGVGGARMLDGFAALGLDDRLTAIVNTGDDFELWGLYISPDIDTVLYTLSGLANVEQGWGIAGDTSATLDAVARLGEDPWFQVGDQDFATHILRTQRLAEGVSLADVTAGFAAALDIRAHIVPMSNEPVRTQIKTDAGWFDFQEYFVGRRHADDVLEVRFDGIDHAKPSGAILPSLAVADLVLICPSNPVVSVDPILGVSGIGDAIAGSPAPVVCVSPIVGGKAIKGPAANMLARAGVEVSAAGVAAYYGDLVDVMVIDEQDSHLEPAIREGGHDVVVLQTIMGDRDDRARLAREILAAL
jgi:LPPG:FO 2-phospho-L-lactate transferase